MTDTPFKVGETYKTRGGEDAVVLAIDFDLEFPLIVKVKSHGRWAMFYRRADGRISETSDFTCDILPPRRGVWVAVDVETGEPREYCDAFRDRPSTQLGDECEWRFFVEAEPQP